MYEQNNDDKKMKFDFKLWKRLLSYPFRNKKFVIITTIAVTLVSLVDIAYSLMSKVAVDAFVEKGSISGFGFYIAAYLALILIQGASVGLFVVFGNRIEVDVDYNMRQDMFYKLQNLSFSYYDKTSAGHIIARVISDVSTIGEVLVWTMIHFTMMLVYIVGIVIEMLILDWQLGLLVMAIVPLLVFVCVYFGNKMLKAQRAIRRHNSNITGAYNECIMGAMTTKTLVREERNYSEFIEETGKMKRATMRYATAQFLFMPLVTILGSVGTALVLYKGGFDVIGGVITYGTLSVFISSMSLFFESIQMVAESFAELQGTQASVERVLQLIDSPIDITDTTEVEAIYGDSFNPKYEAFPEIHGDIEFRNVSFAYKGGEKVLENFNLKVEQGKNIALVGETGAGKSTIVNLICRFYEPTSGQILIDGTDYRERSQAWLQSSLGYVLQQPHLFSGTIRDNIVFGRKDASDEDVIEAAKLVHAHEFITELKDGYNTEVGEGGTLLSTGQKQLISFARVILANPKIFILDEATSSIDTETEQLIQSAITQVLHGRTSFIVAHRLSTIRNADRILVIRDGKITEDGTHDELMALGGYYHDLYTNQFKEEASSAALS